MTTFARLLDAAVGVRWEASGDVKAVGMEICNLVAVRLEAPDAAAARGVTSSVAHGTCKSKLLSGGTIGFTAGWVSLVPTGAVA